MSSLNGMWRFLTGVLISLLGCFGLQAAAFFLFRFGTGKTESNYFSTISRFQGAVAPGAEIAVVGSSITGRFPGREVGNMAVANLGSDGGSPFDGIMLMAEGVVGQPRWLIVESNTLFNGVGYSDTPAVKGAHGTWFHVGGIIPLVGASARPSGMLYARLLARQWNGPGEPYPVLHSPAVVSDPPPSQSVLFTRGEVERLENLLQMLRSLRQSGVRILLANYPAGKAPPRSQACVEAAVARISSELQIPFVDLEAQIPRDSLVFSDSVHLGAASASRVVDTLRAVCRALDEGDH